jgi:K+-transporting ATPase ATPase C chain
LQDRIDDNLKRLKAENPEAAGPVPAELVTASASGLDPHLSPESMLWQLPRVAKARGVARERIKAVVESRVEGRTFGILGEPRVNVLMVNLALDRQFGLPAVENTDNDKQLDGAVSAQENLSDSRIAMKQRVAR